MSELLPVGTRVKNVESILVDGQVNPLAGEVGTIVAHGKFFPYEVEYDNPALEEWDLRYEVFQTEEEIEQIQDL